MTHQFVSRVAKKSRSGTILGVSNHLTRLAALYGGTDKGGHGYLPYYEKHLGPRRLRKQIVVEIGVGGYGSDSPGGSLAVWRDYLVRSTIIGLDIEPKIINYGPRVFFERVDQSSLDDLQRVVSAHGRPNVVIDDGSHVGEHIQASFAFLWPLLPPGGLYVIEDLSTSYYASHGGGNPAPASSGIALVQRLIDDVQAMDVTFTKHPDWGRRTPPVDADVAAVHLYPGIAFINKG